MTNAWIQRVITLGSFIFWWALAAWLWPAQRLAAWGCLLVPVLITPALLGLQCLLAARANRDDPAPVASTGQWLRAWWAEWGVALRVFCWWQPFFHRSVRDQLTPTPGQRGIVLVHGFFCNRALWTDWMRRLRAQGRVFVAVDLEPAYGSINAYAQIVERAVQQVQQATGLPPVLVGHSMGGLAIRAWAAEYVGKTGRLQERVQRIFTLGTPHHGTALARMAFSRNGEQMQRLSGWQQANASQLPDDFAQNCICYHSNCDNIVFPTSTATWPGADNRLVTGRAHVELVFVNDIQQACWAALEN